MIKLASIIATTSVLAFMASSPNQSPDQAATPASTLETVAGQSDTTPNKAEPAQHVPSISEALSAMPKAGGNQNQPFRDADLGSDVLHDPLGRRHRGNHGKLTPELIEQCLEVAHEIKPQLASRLERLRRDSTAQQFEKAMRRNARHLVGLVRLRERNPGLYGLKMRELQTGEQIQQVTNQLREAIDTGSAGQAELFQIELHELVRIQTGQSIEAHGRYLMRIQEHMTALSQQIDQEASNFDPTVERRFQEILDKINASSTISTEPTSG